MGDALQRDADSVRYIVLRKLAPGLRHSLMGDLQTVEFFAEFAARLLDKSAEQSKMRDCIGKIPPAAQEAVKTCHAMIEWLRPQEGSTTSVGEAVSQCLKLAGDDWGLRGIVATADLPVVVSDTKLAKAAARELIIASLLTMADVRPGPMDIDVTAQQHGDGLLLRFIGHPSERVAMFAPSITYHALAWQDLAVLAGDHGVRCSYEDGTVSLVFPAHTG
jgi:hypothetical protein